MKVQIETDEFYMTNDYGNDVPSLRVICSRCGYSVEVFGVGDLSVGKGALMLREECPEEENNYYILSDE
jgi:hypothetical protein